MSGRHISRLGACVRNAVLLPVALLVGCAQIPLGDATPSFENIEKARMSKTAPVAIGKFQVDPRANPDIDKGLSVRSNSVSSPVNGSFAQYLRQTLLVDLQASGLYEPASRTEISGFLTESTLDVPIDKGVATLGARFVVVRLGKTVYEKELKAGSTWASSFVGIEAIPAGINQYAALYHSLVGKLLDDPGYQAANPKD